MHATAYTSVKGIIFDLDGTLYRMRVFFRPLLFLALLRHPFRLQHFRAARSRFAGRDTGSRAALLTALCDAFAKQEHSDPAAMRTWMLNCFYPAFIATMPLQRCGRPRLRDMLHHLRGCGIRLAVLSDYNAVEERLYRLRIPTGCFDTITSCEAAGALKPSARPFLEIAASWNVAPSSILVVGDRDDSDGEAARRAGMQFLMITDRKRPDAPQAYQWRKARDLLMTLGNTADG